MAIALSWSRVSDWQQCNLKFYLKYIAKAFPQEDASKSVHLVKGSEMHKQMESYTYDKINKKDTTTLAASPACRDAFPLIDRVQANFEEIWPERQVAVTYDFKPTEWFGADVAWRSIWDFSGINRRRPSVRGHALIIDWKTGKVTDYDHGEPGQLHLAAAMAIPVYDVDDVDIFYAFLEHKVKRPEKPLRITAEEDYPHIKAFFNKIYDTVNKETAWKPQVNSYCNYCPATKAQCQFSRKP